MTTRLAIVYADDLGVYADDTGLDAVAETMALQLFRPKMNSNISNIDLYRYEVWEKEITIKINVSVDITSFSPTRINQFSQNVKFGAKDITDFLPFVITSLKDGSSAAGTTFGIILLVEYEPQTSAILRKMFKFDHTLLNDVDLYMVTIGGTNKPLSMDYQDIFPVGTKYANIRDVRHVSVYSIDIFKDICPGKYAPLIKINLHSFSNGSLPISLLYVLLQTILIILGMKFIVNN